MSQTRSEAAGPRTVRWSAAVLRFTPWVIPGKTYLHRTEGICGVVYILLAGKHPREGKGLVQEYVALKNLNPVPPNSEFIQGAFYGEECELHAQKGVFPSTSRNAWFSVHHSRHFIPVLLMPY